MQIKISFPEQTSTLDVQPYVEGTNEQQNVEELKKALNKVFSILGDIKDFGYKTSIYPMISIKKKTDYLLVEINNSLIKNDNA